ncbi:MULTISPECIES: TetR/AcrR family transcriptional regulator [Lysinibacillus]|uniref:TetR/AcrR family transcriptional regulator n=1 Tax=Lysinibacillus TaxID=400634 RepID=UPI0012447866|nr:MULTISPECIES: TetR/AcrR family transcriptional regulator [Lysinibacillus]KAB0441988.1 TetR family transcriptional regulator [Lysinibacillus fusiformis]
METNKSTFIQEARKQQIIDATIRTLSDIGYVKSSLAQIAKRASISTALISYHFADRQDLIEQSLQALIEQSATYILTKTYAEDEPASQLAKFIEASIAYQATHPEENIALLEIIFNARTADDIPFYKLPDDGEDPLLKALSNILTKGKEQGKFTITSVYVMAKVIQGAIGEYMLIGGPLSREVEQYSAEVINIIWSAMKVEETNNA